MSRDQMTDVALINFDFVKGELATAEKLTGFVKHVRVSLADARQAIGDPWDTQAHIGDLSFQNLAQTNLARLMGSSDWISPFGGPFQSPVDEGYTLLKADRNSWNLGYPLVKTTRAVLPSDEGDDAIDPIDWDTEVTITTDSDNCLTDRKTSPEDVVEDGDFYVDFYKGTISCYKVTSSLIRLNFSNISRLPAGAPWTTHNVIPTWTTTSSLCNVAEVSAGQYTLTLPTMSFPPRLGSIGRNINNLEVLWENHSPGWGEQYQLPDSWTGFIGQELPEGSIFLWDETLGRVMPQVTFTMTSSTVLALTTPADWLTEGSTYRIIVTGSSLAEQVSYLMTTQRYDQHSGINETAGFSYSIPLSHGELEERYTGDLNVVPTADRFRWQFKESSYPTNPHPQYLHRTGWMVNDFSGNTGNAMRGDFVMACKADEDFDLTTSTFSESYSVSFGLVSNIGLRGGVDLTDWVDHGSTGASDRLPVGLRYVGLIPKSDFVSERMGALTVKGVNGGPLYLEASTDGDTSSEKHRGASIAFDINRQNELNSIKLLYGFRTSSTFDAAHMPANLTQTTWSNLNPCLPLTSNGPSPDQVREWRFRSCSYHPTATNPEDSIGGATTRSGDSAIPEFESYYNGPGMVGADFLNVYSNAIFFSNRGDGKSTSFTQHGEDWMNDPLEATPWTSFRSDGYFNERMPTGLYYHPSSASVDYSHRFMFSIYDGTSDANSQPLNFGDRTGFEYVSNLGGNVRLSTRIEDGESVGGGIFIATGATSKAYVDNLIETSSDETNNIYFGSDSEFSINSVSTMTIVTDSTFTLTAGTGVAIYATAGNVSLTSWTANVSLVANSAITTGSSSLLFTVNSNTLLDLNTTGINYLKSTNELRLESLADVVIGSGNDIILVPNSGNSLFLNNLPGDTSGYLKIATSGAVSVSTS